MFGRVSESRSHGSLSNKSSTSDVSFCSFTNTVPGEGDPEMVVLLYAIISLHPWSKEVGPIEGGNDGTMK